MALFWVLASPVSRRGAPWGTPSVKLPNTNVEICIDNLLVED